MGVRGVNDIFPESCILRAVCSILFFTPCFYPQSCAIRKFGKFKLRDKIIGMATLSSRLCDTGNKLAAT